VSAAGIVLTGGRSSRMGTDKAFVVVGGRPLVVSVADALWEGGCQPVECQGGDVERLASLGLTAHADAEPGRGPVGGIVEALTRAGGPIVVAACDLVNLDADTVRAVAAASRDAGLPAYACAGGRAHLVSAWPLDTLDAVRDLLARGESSYRSALEGTGAVPVEVRADAVHNVNRPGDVEPR
jgi:molybdopterin-guanine dinucleotide biosynthesis protein A